MPAHFYIAPEHFLTGEPQEGLEIVLNRELSHHISSVMRATVGATLRCFDGNGLSMLVEVSHADRRKTQVRVMHIDSAVATNQHPSTHIGLALLKGQAMDRGIQLATELGADHISLVSAKRSNVVLSAERARKKRDHWQRIIISASEQCERTVLPQLTLFANWQELLASTASHPMVLNMTGRPLETTDVAADVLIMVGPEGGWHDTELELFQQQGVPEVCVSKTTLRAETVPSVVLGLVSYLRSR